MQSFDDIHELDEINVSIWQNIALGTLLFQNIVMQMFSGCENDMDSEQTSVIKSHNS